MGKKYIVLLLLIAILAFLVIPVQFEGSVTRRTSEAFASPLFLYEITRIPASGTIIVFNEDNPELGISTDTAVLGFGSVPNDESYSRRFLNVSNTERTRSKVKLAASGPIAEFLSFEENNVFLSEGESKTIPITFRPETGASPGNYTGEITITSIEPLTPLSDLILEAL